MDKEYNQYEETKLICLLAEDSQYAFQVLYDRYCNRIYQVSMRYLKSPVLAQEVTQDVFLKLWFERKNLRKDQSPEAWLYTVAKNNVLNRLKKIAREWRALSKLKDTGGEVENVGPAKLQDSEYEQLLRDAFNKLPLQQQKVFYLARYEGLTYEQIATNLEISPLTVKTHMSRALDNIREYMKVKGIVFLPLIIFFRFLYS
ncbi:MAG: hypothetical protein JWN76_1622 [Chitinophagaceae bacterium]|nr:hypothetical protein [Chitinophagaceae bacterium]